MIRVAICLLLFGVQILKAQRGGGGGIIIAKIYTLQGQIIENSELKIRAFSLQDTTPNSLIKAEIYDAQKTVNRNYLHLPGGSSRLYIIYQNDSMILDLHGVIPPNGAGNRQRMETLAAFRELEQAIIIGLKDEDLRRALNLQCNLYIEAKNPQKAIKSISTLILLDSAHRNFHDGLLFDHYKIRIELYIKTRQFRKALKDYKTVISFSNLDEYYTTSMAAFKALYLHDYKVAISDLKSIIDTIPDNHMFNRLMGYSTYSWVYFTLGQAKYGKGDQSSAFRHWLKAEEIGTASLKTTNYDLLIKKHPEVPELYVARGFVNSHNAIYQKDSYFLKLLTILISQKSLATGILESICLEL